MATLGDIPEEFLAIICPEQPALPESMSNTSLANKLNEATLTRLQNLKKLDLTIEFKPNQFGFLAELQVDSHQPLTSLIEVNARHWDTEDGFDLDVLFPLLTAANVQTLDVYMCCGFGDSDALPAPFSTVKCLTLGASALDKEEFRKVIQLFPELESFEYETGSATVTQMKDETASTHDIVRALQPLSKTLRNLTINQSDREPDDEYSNKPVESLTMFTKLEKLVIWREDLTGEVKEDKEDNEDSEGSEQDESNEEEQEGDGVLAPFLHKLPESLQCLHIIEAAGTGGQLTRLAEIAAEEFTALKEVVVDEDLGLNDVFEGKEISYRVERLQ